MNVRKQVVFDTTAIIRFAEDRSSADPLIAGLVTGYTVRVTATNVEECVATANPEKRDRLLAVCRNLIRNDGEIIRPFHWIIEGLVKAFERREDFDWRNLPLRLPEYEREVALCEITNDEMSAQERAHAANAKTGFEGVFLGAKPHFEELFRTGGSVRPSSAEELVSRLQGEGGAFWSFGEMFYEKVINRKPDERAIRRLVASCPPFHALILAICVAQYELSIREDEGGKASAHRNDLLMAVYLPYCDEFVSDDRGQQRCLRNVASMCGLKTKVRWYREFCDSFLVPGTNLV